MDYGTVLIRDRIGDGLPYWDDRVYRLVVQLSIFLIKNCDRHYLGSSRSARSNVYTERTER
jgi:hypothetical protein